MMIDKGNKKSWRKKEGKEEKKEGNVGWKRRIHGSVCWWKLKTRVKSEWKKERIYVNEQRKCEMQKTKGRLVQRKKENININVHMCHLFMRGKFA